MWIHTNGNMSFYKNGVPLKAKAQQLVPAARFPLRFVMATGSSPGGGYHRNVRWVWTPKNVCNYCFKKGVSSCDDVKATVHDSHGEHHSWLCKKNVPLRDVKYNGGTPYGVLKPSNTSARGVVQYFVSEHRSPPLPPSPLLPSRVFHPRCLWLAWGPAASVLAACASTRGRTTRRARRRWWRAPRAAQETARRWRLPSRPPTTPTAANSRARATASSTGARTLLAARSTARSSPTATTSAMRPRARRSWRSWRSSTCAATSPVTAASV